MQSQTYTLKNGLRVLLVDTKAFPSLTTLLFVGAGSRYEDSTNNGIAHFFEHMAFKGSKKYPNAQVLAELIEGLGGIFNAFTADDHTAYYVKAPAEDAAVVIDVIGDMIQHPLLKEEEIEKEKGVIVQEINMYEDMPQRRVFEIFENLLYKDHPLGYDIIGTKETVTGASRKTFTEYIADWYYPNNAVLVLAGGLTSGKRDIDYYKDLIEKRFKDWQPSDIPSLAEVTESQSEPGLIVQHKKSEQAHFCIGYRTFPRGDKRRYVMTVLATILGSGMSSRLFREVREKRGLCYSIRTYAEYYEDAGYINTYAGVEPNEKKALEAIKVILTEHARMTSELVSDEELERAKELIKGRMILSLEDTQNVAVMFGRKLLFENEVLDIDELNRKIEAVTAEDIRALAQELFVPETLNLALVGPFTDDTNFKKALQ